MLKKIKYIIQCLIELIKFFLKPYINFESVRIRIFVEKIK